MYPAVALAYAGVPSEDATIAITTASTKSRLNPLPMRPRGHARLLPCRASATGIMGCAPTAVHTKRYPSAPATFCEYLPRNRTGFNSASPGPPLSEGVTHGGSSSRLCEEVQEGSVEDVGLLVAHEVRRRRDDDEAAAGDAPSEPVDDPPRIGHSVLSAHHQCWRRDGTELLAGQWFR